MCTTAAPGAKKSTVVMEMQTKTFSKVRFGPARTNMSRAQCPRKAGLPREVVKWLQSLELSVYPRNVRRDFSSGYHVAEIFSHYYPQDFPEHSYDKGASLSAKQKNWSRIQRFLQKQNLHLRKDVIDGTIHCKPGAAELLVQDVYTILTNRSIAVEAPESDFTDQEYQELLPPLARSTASTSIKSNLRKSEILAKPDISTNQRKAGVILHKHLQHRAAERALYPGRFKVKPNLGQLATEGLSPSSQPDDEGTDSPSSRATTSKLCSSSTWSGAAVSFKEMKVLQPVSSSRVNY